VREYLLTLFVAAGVTYLLTGVVRSFAVRAGAVAQVRDRDVHAIPTPRLGGMAMFAGLCAALLVASQLPFMRAVYQQSDDAAAVLTACGLICILGIIDDRWGMDALTKLAGQILAAGVMVLQGIQLIWLPVPGLVTLSLDPTSGAILTVLVVVVTINAVNFVDGLDGLAAGMVAIGALAFFGYSYWLWVKNGLERADAPTLFTAVLAGMCLGFLPHNFHPARIFMGDSGSMLIGLLLAASSISLTGRLDPGAVDRQGLVPALLPLVLPFMVLAVPLVDLLMAVIRRTRAGRSPFSADKEHLHHRLLEIGHSQRRAVLIMYFWSALIAFGAVLIGTVDGKAPVLAGTAALVVLGLFLLVLPRLGRGDRPLEPPLTPSDGIPVVVPAPAPAAAPASAPAPVPVPAPAGAVVRRVNGVPAAAPVRATRPVTRADRPL
jgi:UDP-GlcNAc:undecaprenyl-phosphate/decaprenyl-phosphate GlcNAc-1-phosphate transferase